MKWVWMIALLISADMAYAMGGRPVRRDPLNDDVHTIAIQSDGQLILGGNFTPDRILRMNEARAVDATFGTSWTAGGFNQAVREIVVLADDSLLVGGDFTNFDTSIVGYMVKLDANGNIDSGFASNMGVGFDGAVRSIVVQADGKIIVGGEFQSYNGNPASHIIRLNADGTVDSSFDINFGFNDPVHAVALQSDGLACYAGGAFQSYNTTEYLRLLKLDLLGQAASGYFGQ